MTAVVRLRPARPADLPAILALEQHFPSDRMSARTVRNFLVSPSVSVWVAERRRAVVGCLVLTRRKGSRVARIYSVVVDPAARGLGLGKRLVRQAEAAARRSGLERMSLEVRADNRAARALYAGLGYVEAQKLPGYYDDGADGLRLRKRLARE